MDVVMHDQGVARWARPVFCAACRSAWTQMTFGKQRLRSRRTQRAEPQLETFDDQVARYGAMWSRRSQRRKLQRFYEDAEQLLETP